MDKYEFKERYNENSVILAHRGPYTMNDFFQLAIIRTAFTKAFGRGTGIYTVANLNSPPEEIRPGCLTVAESYILTNNNPTTPDEVLDTWNTYGNVILPAVDHSATSTIRGTLEAIVGLDQDLSFVSGVLLAHFELFNQTWREANEIMTDGGDMKEVFRHQKKVLIDGVNVASMLLERVVENARNMASSRIAIYRASIWSENNIDGMLDDENRIVLMDEKYYLPNMQELVVDAMDQNDPCKIRILIQKNSRRYPTMYYAKAINYPTEDTPMFFLEVPELISSSYPEINTLSSDRSAVGSIDLEALIIYCHDAFAAWKGNITISEKENKDSEEMTSSDVEPPSEDKLVDPLANLIKDSLHGIRKFIKEAFNNVWNNHENAV